MKFYSIVLLPILIQLAPAQIQIVSSFTENFDGYGGTPIVIGQGTPTPTIGAGHIGYSTHSGSLGRARLVTSSDVAVSSPPGVGGNGPTFMTLDRGATGNTVVNEIAFHFDGTAIDQFGAGVRIEVSLRETGDEFHPEDVLAVDDGTQEHVLVNWNALPIQSSWGTFSFDVSSLLIPGLSMSANMRFIIRQRDDGPVPTDGLAVDQVSITAAPSEVDLECVGVVRPTNAYCGPFSSAESFQVRVSNSGNVTIAQGTSVGVFVTLPSSMIAESIVLPMSLAPGDDLVLPLTSTADLSVLTTVNLSAVVSIAGDIDPSNDSCPSVTIASNVGTTVSSFPWTESFDSVVWSGSGNGTTTSPAGWRQSSVDAQGADADWWFRNQPVPSVVTGPAADHTTGVAGAGYFAYVEDAASHAAVELRTPCFDMQSASLPILEFHVAIFDGGSVPAPNRLHVDVVIQPGEVVVADVIAPIADFGDRAWHRTVVDLSAFAGLMVEIRFRATSNGGGVNCDVCIDDVTVRELAHEGGQAPEQGAAVLDLAGARQSDGFDANSGSIPGPYRLTTSPGAPVTWRIGGEPNQEIFLFAGMESIRNFLYAGFGQIDMGMPGTLPPNGLVFIGHGASSINPPTIPLLFTDANGCWTTSINPPGPPGSVWTFQAVIRRSTASAALPTNAVTWIIL